MARRDEKQLKVKRARKKKKAYSEFEPKTTRREGKFQVLFKGQLLIRDAQCVFLYTQLIRAVHVVAQTQ